MQELLKIAWYSKILPIMLMLNIAVVGTPENFCIDFCGTPAVKDLERESRSLSWKDAERCHLDSSKKK